VTWCSRFSTGFAKAKFFSFFAAFGINFFTALKAISTFRSILFSRIFATHRAKTLGLQIVKSSFVSDISLVLTFVTSNLSQRYSGLTTAHTNTLPFFGMIPRFLSGFSNISTSLAAIQPGEWRNITTNITQKLTLKAKLAFLVDLMLIPMTRLASSMRDCRQFFAAANTDTCLSKFVSFLFGKSHNIILSGDRNDYNTGFSLLQI
jgi:hypothetical protein